MYILYGGPFTRALIVEMVMAEGDIAYELREIDIARDEHRTSDYLAINPAGWVPALITPDGETLYETPAISLYLSEHHGLTQLAPRTDEPERGMFLSGLFYITDDLEPVMKRYFYPHRFVLRPEDTAAMKQHSLDIALDRLSVIDQRLSHGGPFHLGERFSLVDLIMTYWACYLEPAELLEPYRAVKHCMALVMDRPKLRAGFDALWAGKQEFAQLKARGGGAA